MLLCSWLLPVLLSIVSATAKRLTFDHWWTPTSEPLIFTIKEPAWLQVVEYRHQGNRFNVYDSGALLGTTSYIEQHSGRRLRGERGNNRGGHKNPSEAIKDIDSYSRGIFELSPGFHNITVTSTAKKTRYNKATAAVRLIKSDELTTEIMLQHGARMVDIEHTITTTSTELFPAMPSM